MPPPPRVANVARAHGDDQAALAEAATALVDQAAGRLNGDPNQWRDFIAGSAAQLLDLQQAAVAQADSYLNEVLAAQGASQLADGAVNPDAFLDFTDGGGSWLRNLLYAPTAAYRNAIAAGAGDTLARSRARHVALSVTLAGMQDAGRSAVGTSMTARPAVKAYVRALRGKSCARCVILAGRRYRVSAFRRHPR